MISPIIISGFSSEFVKIAEHTFHNSVDSLQSVLMPGDILATKPRSEFLKDKPFQRVLRKFLVGLQGTEYTHTGIYDGDGKVVDSGLWKGRGVGVASIPLKEYADRYQFRVLRTRADSHEREDAVEYANSQVGKKFSMLKMLRLGLPVPRTKEKRTRLNLDTLICSELVANAYPNQSFADGRHVQHVRPVDIQRSPLTKIVSEMR